MTHSDLLHALLAPPGADGRFHGVVVGIVTNNRDPEAMHRVKVRFPWLGGDDESNWARVASPMAGNDRGLYCLPEVDDEVVVAFEHGRIDRPYVLGALWNGRDAPPETNRDGRNDARTFKSRSGHVIRLDDRDGDETIEIVDRSGDNRLVIRSADGSIAIEAQGDISITSRTGKVSIGGVGIELVSQAGARVQAAQGVEVSAAGQVDVKGALINLN